MSYEELRKILHGLMYNRRVRKIMSILRGPDAVGNGPAAAKTIFTAKLRYIVAGGPVMGLWRRGSKVLLEELELILLEDADVLRHLLHYLGHCEEAFHAVAELYPEYRREAEFLAELAGKLSEIVAVILDIELNGIAEAIPYLDIRMYELQLLLDEYSDYITEIEEEYY